MWALDEAETTENQRTVQYPTGTRYGLNPGKTAASLVSRGWEALHLGQMMKTWP
jgi:hypothetical protein